MALSSSPSLTLRPPTETSLWRERVYFAHPLFRFVGLRKRTKRNRKGVLTRSGGGGGG